MIDPIQPTRSAITVAGISGNSASIDRTRSSNGVNDVAVGARSYLGGAVEATTFTTVVREIPNRSAICFCGTPLPSKAPDQRPVLHSDHTPIVECSLFERRH